MRAGQRPFAFFAHRSDGVAVLAHLQPDTAGSRRAAQYVAEELELLGQRGFGVEGRPLAAAMGVEAGVGGT